jgi:hypothetical protein
MNTLTWFEIPVLDMDRAARFYETLLECQIRKEIFGGLPNGIFVTADEKALTGSLVQGEHYIPNAAGAVVYMNVTGKLDAVLGRVQSAGGQVALPKTSIGPRGFFAWILDSEGNRVGLHDPLVG